MSIDAKQAAHAAATYYENISDERVKLSIEEIEFDDKGFWLITLGISDSYGMGSISSFVNKVREYKLFKIDSNSGEVKSMKIRKV